MAMCPMISMNYSMNTVPGCLTLPKLAHAYVPFQYMSCVYPPMKGLHQGTVFPELDRPYGVDPEYTVDA